MLKKITQCKPVIPLMTSLMTLVLVSSAEAVTVNRDVNGDVTSIEGLQIIERGVVIPGEEFLFTVTSTYDIDFSFDSFNTTFGDPSQPDTSCEVGVIGNGLCFWDNPSRADLVIDEINRVFNNLNPIPLNVAAESIFLPGMPFMNDFFFVPVGFNNVNIISRQGRKPGDLWSSEDANFSQIPDNFDSYLGAQLTAQEFKEEIPESSNLIGIIVTGLSIIFLTKKK